MPNEIYSVTQLNQEVKTILEKNPPFRNIFVRGEISNFKAHSSGHYYLTLKDLESSISAVMFRSDAIKLRFRLENGMTIVARGRVSAFPRSGQVQLYLADLMPDGAGALHMAFEQLKQRLHAEGLFDEARKRPLPLYPQTIALITSPTGAAVCDMVRILARRWPCARVRLYPALVQGTGAPESLCRALALANAHSEADVLIIGRGGGSAEDLWAFNDERLARAISASYIPIISAVGHEPDVTISDFVADLRAPTPSGAAELAVPDMRDVKETLQRLHARILRDEQIRTQTLRQRTTWLIHRLSLRTPLHVIADKHMLLAHFAQRLQACSPEIEILARKSILAGLDQRLYEYAKNSIVIKQNNLSYKIAELDALSPLKVLARGYAVALNTHNQPILDSGTLSVNSLLELRFFKGRATCKILDTQNERTAEDGSKKETLI